MLSDGMRHPSAFPWHPHPGILHAGLGPVSTTLAGGIQSDESALLNCGVSPEKRVGAGSGSARETPRPMVAVVGPNLSLEG